MNTETSFSASFSDDNLINSLNESISLELELLTELDYRQDPRPGQREGVVVLQKLIKEFSTESFTPDSSDIALLLMRLRDLQVRDFALGCMTKQDVKEHVEFWRWVVRIAPTAYKAPPATLLSATAYELGETHLAESALESALDADPQYPLALLLKRVFAAGWPPETFATMRTELHPKIITAIFDE